MEAPAGRASLRAELGCVRCALAAEESTTFDWLGLSERGQRAPEPELATFCMLRQAQRRMILQGAFEHSSRAYDEKADRRVLQSRRGESCLLQVTTSSSQANMCNEFLEK